jgi:hypothetical protein
VTSRRVGGEWDRSTREYIEPATIYFLILRLSDSTITCENAYVTQP